MEEMEASQTLKLLLEDPAERVSVPLRLGFSQCWYFCRAGRKVHPHCAVTETLTGRAKDILFAPHHKQTAISLLILKSWHPSRQGAG